MCSLAKITSLLSLLKVVVGQLVLPPPAGTAALPIIPNHALLDLSAESRLMTQLRSWGIDIQLDLDVNILGLELLNTRPRRRSRETERGLNLKLDLGLDRIVSGLVNIGLGDKLGINADVRIGSWGQADSATRGERGDSAWITSIELGSPPQSIPVIPDTGSGDLFVYASSCSTCGLSNHSSYDPASSRLFTNLSHPWNVLYQDESGADGYIVRDKLSFGGSSALNTDLAFGLATSILGDGLLESSSSGVLGLSLDGLSTMPATEINKGATLFSRLVKGRKVPQPVLSIRLDKGRSEQGVVAEEGGGQLTFGGVEESYVVGGRGGLTWAQVSSSLYWGFGLSDVSMGTRSAMSMNDSTHGRAIVDTGTTLILTSDEIAKAVHAQIPASRVTKGAGTFYIPCNTTYPNTPNLFFTIGTQRFGIPIEDLAWSASTKYPGMCISGVQGGLSHFTVLGDIFIKNHYVVLSYDGGKLDKPNVGIGHRTDLPVVK